MEWINILSTKKFYLKIPRHLWLPLLVAVLWNQTVYYGAKLIAGNWPHYNIELAIDSKIPLVPCSVLIYFGCYLFWIANYVICTRPEPGQVCRFFCADFLAKLICLVCFVTFPTTNTRPIIQGTGIWETVMRFLYRIDSPSNLFPSIHCLVSWLCFIGVRNNKTVPYWYRVASLIMAIAVFVSTLTTKQHVIVDVFGGIFIAELSFWIAGHTGISDIYKKWMKI